MSAAVSMAANYREKWTNLAALYRQQMKSAKEHGCSELLISQMRVMAENAQEAADEFDRVAEAQEANEA